MGRCERTFDFFRDGNKLVPGLLVANDRGALGPVRRANEGSNEPGYIGDMRKHDGHIARSRDRSYVVRNVDSKDKWLAEVAFDLGDPVVIQEKTIRDELYSRVVERSLLPAANLPEMVGKSPACLDGHGDVIKV